MVYMGISTVFTFFVTPEVNCGIPVLSLNEKYLDGEPKNVKFNATVAIICECNFYWSDDSSSFQSILCAANSKWTSIGSFCLGIQNSFLLRKWSQMRGLFSCMQTLFLIQHANDHCPSDSFYLVQLIYLSFFKFFILSPNLWSVPGLSRSISFLDNLKITFYLIIIQILS